MMRSLFLALCMMLPLSLAATARADVLETYDFTGTIAPDYGTSGLVTGQFTLDLSNQTISTYSFVTPIATYSPATDSVAPIVAQYTPATSPKADFVGFFFASSTYWDLTLYFETDFAGFPRSNFWVFRRSRGWQAWGQSAGSMHESTVSRRYSSSFSP